MMINKNSNTQLQIFLRFFDLCCTCGCMSDGLQMNARTQTLIRYSMIDVIHFTCQWINVVADHCITPISTTLHQLPAHFRIDFKNLSVRAESHMSLRGSRFSLVGSKILTFRLKAGGDQAYQILFFCYCEALCMNKALKGALHITCIIVIIIIFMYAVTQSLTCCNA